MILGYLLIGAVVGLLASLMSLLLGESFWLALGIYVLVGSAVTTMLPLVHMVMVFLAPYFRNLFTAVQENGPEYPRSLGTSEAQQNSQPKSSMRILAVDDDPFILDLVPMICSKAGFSDVTLAASGERALGLLTRSEPGFDCLLLDISMPGMDGIKLCAEVRKLPQHRATPILMLTAMRDIENMGDAYRVGATDYVTKPFDIAELETRLRRAQDSIQSRRQADAARQEDHADGHHLSTRSPNSELFRDLQLNEVCDLVEYAALSSFLTQLPGNKVEEIKLFAVSIDDIEELHGRASAKQFSALLQDIVMATAGCFSGERPVMAYSEDATLLIASSSTPPPTAIDFENELERWLKRRRSEYIGEIGISAGGPVSLSGAKAERAGIAVAQVISFANNRSLDKHGRKVAGRSQSDRI